MLFEIEGGVSLIKVYPLATSSLEMSGARCMSVNATINVYQNFQCVLHVSETYPWCNRDYKVKQTRKNLILNEEFIVQLLADALYLYNLSRFSIRIIHLIIDFYESQKFCNI